eukprot:4626690-Pleurochrysis_carterae.AAC.2
MPLPICSAHTIVRSAGKRRNDAAAGAANIALRIAAGRRWRGRCCRRAVGICRVRRLFKRQHRPCKTHAKLTMGKRFPLGVEVN